MFWILLCISVATLCYFAFIRHFQYWSKLGIVQYNIWTIWVELILGFIPYRSLSEAVQKTYDDFSGHRYCGVYQFHMPAIFIRDIELLKQMAIKDFDHFVDHRQVLPEDSEPLWEKNLFSLKGDTWRHMRSTLSPSFTASKMKIMFGLISQCAKQFVEHFQSENKAVVTLELKDAFSRFANDVIGTTAFGVTCNSLKDPENEFYLMGKAVTNFSGLFNNLKLIILLVLPRVSQILGLTFFDRKVTTFFSKLVKDNIESRKKNNIVRPDMIHLLMEAQKERVKEMGEKEILTDVDIAAQALIFFFAGFDSVSTLMCFMSYELAINPNIQNRLQEEIDDVLIECDGNITYEALHKMKYMDMVISGGKMAKEPPLNNYFLHGVFFVESLRKWTAASIADRVCVKPYTIEPVLEHEKPVHLKKGDVVWFPYFGIHKDPQYFPEPERFDPERFSDENKSDINPYTFLPFGLGPRSCIGNRFALMETKLVFFYLLSKFNITVVEKSMVPLKLAKSQFQLSAEGGFWFGLKRRETQL